MNNLHFFPYKSLSDQILRWHKTGQGQPRIIIWTILVELHTQCYIQSFKAIHSFLLEKKIFSAFYHLRPVVAMLVMWPRSFEQLFIPESPGGCIQNLVTICPVVSEKTFEIVDRWMDDDRRQTTEPVCPISSPRAKNLLGVIKSLIHGGSSATALGHVSSSRIK